MINDYKQICFADCYDIQEEIGSGQFAVVRRCREKCTGKEYAAKYIRKCRVVGSRRGMPIEDIHREVSILRSIEHQNIMRFHDAYENAHEVILVLELISGGELFEYVSQREKLDEKEASAFIHQILWGLQHLHEKGIVHLDLKPENVLLTSKDGKELKIIDFGLARWISPGVDYREMLGTPEFVAPEVVCYEPIGYATDLWSVGVVTYILISGASPFLGQDKQETFTNVTAADYSFDPQFFSGISDSAKDFISRLLVRDPRKRPAVDECLSHPWIMENNTVESEKMSSSAEMLASNVDSNHNTNGVPQDENFLVAAVFSAVDEGNLTALEELFLMSSSLDPNCSNRHGETAVHIAAGLGHLDILKFLDTKKADLARLDSHGDSAICWAAGQGHELVIRYLHEQGVPVDTRNKAGETALHVAARYGHVNAIQVLITCKADINITDEHDETALHIAAWHGFPKIVHALCCAGARSDFRNKESETPLHCAAVRGHHESVRCLIEGGADTDLLDKHGCTALHLSLRRHHTTVAMMLLHAGCQVDIIDNIGEAPIHIVSYEGLLALAQTLCAFGCKVDVPNKVGLYPIHMAAKNGNIEIIRCLCLAGCNVEEKNKDGITAEITALAQGYSSIGELLGKLKNEQHREEYITQLVPTSQPIGRIKLKVFGHSGVGKTAVVDTLKAGYFSGWFRRSRSSPSNSFVNGVVGKEQDPNESGISFETNNENYTKGIDIQQVSISGAGDFSLWDFSGHEPYHMLYDHFVGNVHCLHAIVFCLSDPLDVQLQQVFFWLAFLQARIPPAEPLGHCGRSQTPPRVVMIATHADVASAARRNVATSEFESDDAVTVLEGARRRFGNVFEIHDVPIVMDALQMGSPAVKALKQYLTTHKAAVLKGLPKHTLFLEGVLTQLSSWRKTNFPVMTWQLFMETVQSQVNLLAGEDHLKELVQQLQLVGEVLYLKSDNQDLVVLSPRWLCVDVIGHLLSQDHIRQSRVTGCYTVDDAQLLFPDSDTLDLLQVLEAIHLCTQCDNEGDFEYEFPCFNMVETLKGLWEPGDPRYAGQAVYGGVRLQCLPGVHHMLRSLFPRLQVQLRRTALEQSDPDSDLYQWCHGSKFCSGPLEGMITLVDSGEAIEVKVRGPSDMQAESFYFLEDLLSVVAHLLQEACPGLLVEKHLLSSSQLRQHSSNVVGYSPDKVLRSLLASGRECRVESESGEDERVLDLLLCCVPATLAPELHADHLSLLTKQRLCELLDPPDPLGRDWCMLGILLGLTDKLPRLDPGDNPSYSRTGRVLEEWCRESSSTVGKLLDKLEELGRHDAVDVILRTSPFLKVFPAAVAPNSSAMIAGGNDLHPNVSESYTSSSNLSR